MNSDVRSQNGEEVCEFVWLAVAAYDKTERAFRSLEDWRDDSNSSRPVLSAISEVVSHVEVFVVESLTMHAKLISASSVEPIPDIVMNSISKPVESSWNERRKFIKTWLGVDVVDAGWWRSWLGFVDARNAWAHGLGRLTSRQRNSQEVLANLRAAGLAVQASKVVGTPADVKKCAKSAVEVIDWIDQRVRRV
ncbi:hypothetical protein [Mycobacterium avium]|uniref:hypothetical protein n=1 Tax=Mycobacterium avium TaxID=1764 RepID=UPI001009CB42|nr:hypothetical protein [Mycobacterium avium]MDV3265725.1 hypothetical protein [Mycobacterium avium]UEA18074.1 hypothetical protein LK460_12450 [Mycobacterium avium subsp. avium]UEA35079.1 hypothetical protein LK466_03350 [Mycobacterium avium subsp. avium]UGU13503.1 hypothetical protein LTQ57_09765 [Mycobacterium avium subsp. avium]UGU18830.1 hypothetical protein LT348_14290 [Mycobacterium avium subsp. avium]